MRRQVGDVGLARGARGEKLSLLGLDAGDHVAELGAALTQRADRFLHVEPRHAHLRQDGAVLVGEPREAVEGGEGVVERLGGEYHR